MCCIAGARQRLIVQWLWRGSHSFQVSRLESGQLRIDASDASNSGCACTSKGGRGLPGDNCMAGGVVAYSVRMQSILNTHRISTFCFVVTRIRSCWTFLIRSNSRYQIKRIAMISLHLSLIDTIHMVWMCLSRNVIEFHSISEFITSFASAHASSSSSLALSCCFLSSIYPYPYIIPITMLILLIAYEFRCSFVRWFWSNTQTNKTCDNFNIAYARIIQKYM